MSAAFSGKRNGVSSITARASSPARSKSSACTDVIVGAVSPDPMIASSRGTVTHQSYAATAREPCATLAAAEEPREPHQGAHRRAGRAARNLLEVGLLVPHRSRDVEVPPRQPARERADEHGTSDGAGFAPAPVAHVGDLALDAHVVLRAHGQLRKTVAGLLRRAHHQLR